MLVAMPGSTAAATPATPANQHISMGASHSPDGDRGRNSRTHAHAIAYQSSAAFICCKPSRTRSQLVRDNQMRVFGLKLTTYFGNDLKLISASCIESNSNRTHTVDANTNINKCVRVTLIAIGRKPKPKRRCRISFIAPDIDDVRLLVYIFACTSPFASRLICWRVSLKRNVSIEPISKRNRIDT